MTIGQIILGVLMFAVVTAVLYAWGLSKSLGQKEDLARNLLRACGSRVVKYLKTHETITAAEVARQIEGVTVGQFWSRNKLKVQDAGKFSGQVIDFLLNQQYIESAGKGAYRLKK